MRKKLFLVNPPTPAFKSQNLTSDFHLTSNDSKGLSENSKKMSWDDPVFPRAAKNSIGFFVQFFLSYPTVVGGSVQGVPLFLQKNK